MHCYCIALVLFQTKAIKAQFWRKIFYGLGFTISCSGIVLKLWHLEGVKSYGVFQWDLLEVDQKCKQELEAVFLLVLVLVLEQTLLPGKATKSRDTLATHISIIYSQGGPTLRALSEQKEKRKEAEDFCVFKTSVHHHQGIRVTFLAMAWWIRNVHCPLICMYIQISIVSATHWAYFLTHKLCAKFCRGPRLYCDTCLPPMCAISCTGDPSFCTFRKPSILTIVRAGSPKTALGTFSRLQYLPSTVLILSPHGSIGA